MYFNCYCLCFWSILFISYCCIYILIAFHPLTTSFICRWRADWIRVNGWTGDEWIGWMQVDVHPPKFRPVAKPTSNLSTHLHILSYLYKKLGPNTSHFKYGLRYIIWVLQGELRTHSWDWCKNKQTNHHRKWGSLIKRKSFLMQITHPN